MGNYYYLVAVRSNRYHSSDPLTYSAKQQLTRGAIVEVELQKELVMGVVTGGASEPRFKTKEIRRIFDLPTLPHHLLRLSQWMADYYPSPLGMQTQQLLPVSLSEKQLSVSTQTIFPAPNSDNLPPLTTQQRIALKIMNDNDTYLLHGKTGSGKTRLYIELALLSISAGKSAVILTPEISLTTQLAASFREVFSSRVIVMHSNQAPSERRAAWLTCLRSTEPLIIVGPRSALFSPLTKLGLIVLDEAHEAAYKQEQAPQYQTSRVAAYLANLTRASLILGSATPAISDFYIAKAKHKPIVTLTELAQRGEKNTSDITIIDHKDASLFSRSPHLSNLLIDAVSSALKRGEQSLLYLNRRGTARLIMCENCGWQANCPHCDLPLTYHGDKHELRCHSCNHHEQVKSSCPVCGHPSILFKTAGTKAVVDAVDHLFPGAHIARFDTDNTKAERFEQRYDAIKDGKVDILIGTQLLAKGLDLPRLSTLGIVLADTSLYMPDYSAQERTFQLISQVLGRIGRGHIAGRAVIQTYHPNHPVLKAAIEGNYQAFYENELEERAQFLFPPFCYLLKLSVRRSSIKAAEKAAQSLKEQLQEAGYHVRIEGPAPSFYEHFQNKFQWQLIVKATERSELTRIISSLPSSWSYDIDPVDLL